MGFIYRDITNKSIKSGQYEVLLGDISLGIVVETNGVWRVIRPEHSEYESDLCSSKEEAARRLAELAGIPYTS